MSDIAIQIDQLGKKYRLGLTHARSLRELADSLMGKLFRRHSNGAVPASGENAEFWALRDVSFSVQQGETVGLIGKNGAGKSTLLKILSRITKPSTGQARIIGRVGSLLEVGTGFHPELTGRENIFLNGTILGMKRREIARKLDEIIDFSEIEKFIDTPVKRYSSGMYVRLAFAVAAHLEPDVLIVDEVLAVGDSSFQRKCLGRMETVGRDGRTVLFVSHNMGAIKQLCHRAVLLEKGQLIDDGPAAQVVDNYLRESETESADGVILPSHDRIGTGEARVTKVRVLNETGAPAQELMLGEKLHVQFEFTVHESIPDAHFEVSLHGMDGVNVAVTHREIDLPSDSLSPGNYVLDATVDVALLPRRYAVGVGIYRENGYSVDFLERTVSFQVSEVGITEGGHYRWGQVRGYVRPKATWNLQRQELPSRCTAESLRVREASA